MEVRLGEGRPGADLIASSQPESATASLLPWTPAWVAQFARAMLVYELLERPLVAPPATYVFPHGERKQASFTDPGGAFRDLLRMLDQETGSPDVRNLLLRLRSLAIAMENCKGSLFALGIRSAPRVGTLRCELRIQEKRIPDFLRLAGWVGDMDMVHRGLQLLAQNRKRVRLSVDLRPTGIAERVGLLIYGSDGFGGGAQHAAEWRTMLSILSAEGLCVPAKAAGLRSWFGLRPVFVGGCLAYSTTWLNHVKISIAGRDISAKGYLGMALLWPRDQRLDPEIAEADGDERAGNRPNRGAT